MAQPKLTRVSPAPRRAPWFARPFLWLAIALLAGVLFWRFAPLDEGVPLPDEPADNAALASRSHGSSEHGDDSDARHDVEPREQQPRPASASSARVVRAPGEAAGSVEGAVRSRADGSAVAGAELTFERDGVVVAATSGSDGRYRFEAPRDGTWQLATVAAQGFLPFAPEWGQSSVSVQALKGKRIEGATLWLEPAVEYTGLVLGADDKPVRGA
jgi:hypothetical protein